MLACFGLAVFCFIMVIIISRNQGKKKQKTTATVYSVFTPNGLQVVKKIEQLYLTNQNLPFTGLYKIYDGMFGKPANTESENYKKLIGIDGYEDLPDNAYKSIAGEYLSDMEWALHERWMNTYSPLHRYNEAEAMKRFGINLGTNEVICDYASNTDWLEEKTTTVSYTYSGLRYSGSGALRYTFGTLSVIPNTRTYFDIVDRGNVYITNKRIIFVGTQNHKNRTIDIDNLLEFTIFKDGILLGKANGKKPLIQFPEYLPQPPKIVIKRDHLSRISLALSRVMNNTWNQQLEIPE